MRRGSGYLKLTFLLALLWLAPVASRGSSLEWDAKKGVVSADVQGWKLPELLRNMAQKTGWDIFVEPDTERVVWARFKDLSQGDALRLLLGEINYALLPQPKGPQKLLIFQTTLSKATQKIAAKRDTSIPIPNEFIIKVKPGTDIEALARELGAEIVGRDDKTHTYRFQFKDKEAADAARELTKTNESVVGTDSNYYVERGPTSPNSQSGPGSQGIPQLKVGEGSGEQTLIALIDTAIQLTGTEMDKFLLPYLDGTIPTAAGETPNHATAMFQAILAGMAEAGGTDVNVRIRPHDVFSSGGTTYEVAQAIIRAMAEGSDIINLSLGSGGDSEYLRAVVKYGLDHGVQFVAASGNDGTSQEMYPAAWDGVVAVGSPAAYANYGPWVDMQVDGDLRLYYNGRAWQTYGTSVSAARTTGRIAVQGPPPPAK